MKSSRPLALLVAAVLGVAVLGAAWAGWQRWGADWPDPSVTYTLLDGSQHRVQQLQGKVVLVNFWATTCAACVAEMPAIVDTHRRFGARGYDTLAVAMRYDPPALVSRFAEGRALPFGVAIDNTGLIAQGFGGVELTPTTFVLDRQGRVVKRYVGIPDFNELHALIEALLADAG
jgi:peroxiredoxin